MRMKFNVVIPTEVMLKHNNIEKARATVNNIAVDKALKSIFFGWMSRITTRTPHTTRLTVATHVAFLFIKCSYEIDVRCGVGYRHKWNE